MSGFGIRLLVEQNQSVPLSELFKKGFIGSITSEEENLQKQRKMSGFIEGSPYNIGYVTDLEGNWNYWNEYIKISHVLKRSATGILVLEKNCCFVHGGDAVDRGNGDNRILIDFLQLKRDYPDRVFFIVGNRDVNKLRLWFSLQPTVLKYNPKAFWIPEAQTPTEGCNTPADRLKWILKATMGAPFAFECHRQEIQETNPSMTISDEQIVENFLQLINPSDERNNNYLFQYLNLGQMSLIIGDTMFVHGAITSFELGYVPPIGENGEAKYCSNPIEWDREINQFYQQELHDYKNNFEPYLARLGACTNMAEIEELLWDCKGDYNCAQPASRLVQCGMGMKKDKSTNPGVIYASYLSNGKPVRIDSAVSDWLQRGQIRNVLVGHQPNGDTPMTIKHLGIQTISADSSYSKFLMWQPKDLALAVPAEKASLVDMNSTEFMAIDKFLTTVLNETVHKPETPTEQANTRSDSAVNEIVISFPSTPQPTASRSAASPAAQATVVIHGKISLGADYTSHIGNDQYVGRETTDGWWVKAANARFTPDGPLYYVLAQSEGFNFRSKLVLASEMSQLTFTN